MLLKSKKNDGLIKISFSELEELIDPFQEEIKGQIQAGQNEQPPESFKKADLAFPSGENLPVCWLDQNYKSE
ncbi:MAG: hypothetical protein Tsb0014_00550 [Pleurocapsa sp.]